MFYYEVIVSSQRYHGKHGLTYSSETQLQTGTIVAVPLQRAQVTGVVQKSVPQPKFAVKPISTVLFSQTLPTQLLLLYHWLSTYYPAPSGTLGQLILPFSAKTPTPAPDQKNTSKKPEKMPDLTTEQSHALHVILNSESTAALLHGDTGTGKTRVYQDLLRKTLLQGQSAIVLTPEIGLTPQLSMTLEKYFPNRVITMHSGLTPKERRNNWSSILYATNPIIVVGPRSALFVPVRNIGLIIVDEAHDNAYKQEQLPYYQTTRVAAKLATLHNARLLLGSATPNIIDYYLFQIKNLPIIRMRKPAIANSHTTNRSLVVDLKTKENFTRSPWLSLQLLEAIKGALRDKKQSLIFLNRRGSARLMLCQSCGWQYECPRCDLPLTYHADTHLARCHTCGYSHTAPTNCGDCDSADIVFRQVGTKTIVEELQRLFPRASLKRFDSDIAKSESLEQQYEELKAGKFDLIVGTQMLSKGLDLPKLSVVGVIAADTGLYFPDFTAEERTYQMLSQVIGRVGRGHSSSTIVIQTYHPASKTIQHALHKNYEDFYTQQLIERKKFGFPPFRYVLKLNCKRANSKNAQQNAEKLYQRLRTQKLPIDIIGPAPAFTERTNKLYNWQIVVSSTTRSNLTRVIDLLPVGWTYDIDPSNLL